MHDDSWKSQSDRIWAELARGEGQHGLMDFTVVSQRVKELFGVGEGLTATGDVSQQHPLSLMKRGDEIYGRVCTVVGKDAPLNLSSDTTRKSVFVFGWDAIERLILKDSTYDILCSLGRDKEYLHHMMVEQQCSFWLILFTSDAFCGESDLDTGTLSIVPATWDGVINHVKLSFPEAINDLMKNIEDLKRKKLEDFEKEAGFSFLDAKKNRYGRGVPPYYSYDYFCSLPKPRAAWQVRAFLYCELRLLKLFTGDGYTLNEGGSRERILEYLCPNIKITDLDARKCVVVPMNVKIPDILTKCHQTV